jgi:hypothetical protein
MVFLLTSILLKLLKEKPDADITDYFNYGLNENTWLAYYEHQRKMRCNKSLVGMATLAMHNQQTSTTTANNNLIPTEPVAMVVCWVVTPPC